MADKREKEMFIVSDKRKFTSEGEVREDAVTSSEPVEEPKIEPKAHDESKPSMEKVVELSPEDAAKKQEAMPPLPTAEEQTIQHADYKSAGKQVDDMLREHGAPPNAFRETSFEQLVMSLYITALVQLGAVRQENQPPTPPDIMAARQTIDTLGVLNDKTAGNLNEKESNLLQHSLFELRMTYVEVIKMLNSAPKVAPATTMPPKK